MTVKFKEKVLRRIFLEPIFKAQIEDLQHPLRCRFPNDVYELLLREGYKVIAEKLREEAKDGRK